MVGGCGGAVTTFFIGVVCSDGIDLSFDFGGVLVVVFFRGRGIGGLDSLTVDCVKPIVVGSHADLTLLSAFAIRFLNFGSPVRIIVRLENVFCWNTGSDSVPSMVRRPVDISYSGGLLDKVLCGGFHTDSRALDEGGA